MEKLSRVRTESTEGVNWCEESQLKQGKEGNLQLHKGCPSLKKLRRVFMHKVKPTYDVRTHSRYRGHKCGEGVAMGNRLHIRELTK